ncbi:hypothetical protein ACFO1B_38665 [Dactylosporangium siamense]|uniref:Uncharacterized protein n=1 Tax=Dactylosporangium siamense TaxID=685454 RepID=A0A919PUF3_9ACTN|nr:hypothetical protein [Dactylosporangium siamense]GIG50399.1 hypothetical protein Dsi01nite_084400 [Dactylosporangium siamense]
MDITSFDMRWEIGGSGWATLTWIADDDALKVITSYTGHGLRSLLRAAADLRLGSSASLAWLSDEPHAHVFVFTGAAEYVYVQILVLPDEYAEDPWVGAKRCWDGRVPVEALTTAAARMAQTVLDRYGEAGYKQAWRNMPFPSTELAILQGEHA